MEEIKQTKKTSGKALWWIVLAVVAVLLVLWWTDNLGTTISVRDTYQAVFLTNNQVYFGKLTEADSEYPVLRDVYYLQIAQTIQPRERDAPPATNVNLIKLGGEIHGPLDEMVINRDHILFYEDLKDDSQVMRAIRQFKENQ